MEYPTYLIHYGVQGQKWGVRRFQNEDGSWTEEGLARRKRLTDRFGDLSKEGVKHYNNAIKEMKKSKEYKDYQKIDKEYYEITRKATDKANTEAYKSIGKEKEYNDTYVHKHLIGETKQFWGEPDKELHDYFELNPEIRKKWGEVYNKTYDMFKKEHNLDEKYSEVEKHREKYIDVGQKYLDRILGKNKMNLRYFMYN